VTDQRLRRALGTLHKELNDAEGIDDASHQRLRKVAAAIEQGLGEVHHTEHRQGLVKLLRDEIAYLEVSHPRVTEALNEIMTTLSAGGA
jgi:hypothetical protein